jgi:hypothetical protein
MASFIVFSGDRRARWQAGAVLRRALALRVLPALIGVLVILLTVAQLVLPGLAADEARDKVARYGRVQSVSVSAWPAVTLLWGSARSLRLRAGRLAITPAQSAALLAQASGIDRIDADVTELAEGPLTLHDATVRKRGRAVSAEGFATAAALRGALAGGVTLLGGAPGGVRVAVAGELFGAAGSVVALVRCSGGRLVVETPGRVRLVLFADRRIYLTGVGAAAAARRGGYRLWVTARLP